MRTFKFEISDISMAYFDRVFFIKQMLKDDNLSSSVVLNPLSCIELT